MIAYNHRGDGELLKVQGNLAYTGSSRPATAAQWVPVANKKASPFSSCSLLAVWLDVWSSALFTHVENEKYGFLQFLFSNYHSTDRSVTLYKDFFLIWNFYFSISKMESSHWNTKLKILLTWSGYRSNEADFSPMWDRISWILELPKKEREMLSLCP